MDMLDEIMIEREEYILKYGKAPTILILGNEYYRELKLSVSSSCCVPLSDPTGEEFVVGMKLIRSNAKYMLMAVDEEQYNFLKCFLG